MKTRDDRLAEVKRSIRSLKNFEIKIRGAGVKLVWDSFFKRAERNAPAKYTAGELAAMDKEAYHAVAEEFFFNVYFQLYKERGALPRGAAYDPEILSRLGLPATADAAYARKRFRELAKTLHPDAGGDGGAFVEMMENYRKLQIK